VDRQRLTQVGRAMRELGVEMIPAYSPQARGRSERNFGTWQRRLPQELRLRGITTREEANQFLRESYVAEFNRKFAVRAAQPESAFVPVGGKDVERIFTLQQERVVNRDNTISFANIVNGTGSLVLTDDLEIYNRLDMGMSSEGSEWLQVGRGYQSDLSDAHGGRRGKNSTSEVYIRNMLDAWLGLMTKGDAVPARAAS